MRAKDYKSYSEFNILCRSGAPLSSCCPPGKTLTQPLKISPRIIKKFSITEFKARDTMQLCLIDSLVFTLGYCVNFKVMRYELRSFSKIVADKLHCDPWLKSSCDT